MLKRILAGVLLLTLAACTQFTAPQTSGPVSFYLDATGVAVVNPTSSVAGSFTLDLWGPNVMLVDFQAKPLLTCKQQPLQVTHCLLGDIPPQTIVRYKYLGKIEKGKAAYRNAGTVYTTDLYILSF